MTSAQHLTCAQLCAAAYDDSDSRFLDVDEIRVGVIQVEDTTYLVNCGTRNLAGWIDDFKAFPWRTMGGYLAHHGFIDAGAKVWNVIYPLTKDIPNLIITGHSLGGSQAVLQAERLNKPLVTFGCPRVYSRLNETFPTMNHARYVNSGDPVPDVPGPVLWRHLCDSIILGDERIDVKYHDINLYISRLTEQKEKNA